MVTNTSAHLIETINKLVRTSRQLLLVLGREPTPEEIAVEAGPTRRESTEAIGRRPAADCLDTGLTLVINAPHPNAPFAAPNQGDPHLPAQWQSATVQLLTGHKKIESTVGTLALNVQAAT